MNKLVLLILGICTSSLSFAFQHETIVQAPDQCDNFQNLISRFRLNEEDGTTWASIGCKHTVLYDGSPETTTVFEKEAPLIEMSFDIDRREVSARDGDHTGDEVVVCSRLNRKGKLSFDTKKCYFTFKVVTVGSGSTLRLRRVVYFVAGETLH